MYIRFPLSLRQVEELLFKRSLDVSYETVRFWWNRFGPLFAAQIRKKRLQYPGCHSNWRWHLDEVFVKVNGETRYLWRVVDHEGEVLNAIVTKKRDRKAALSILKRLIKKYGRPATIVTDRLRSYKAALNDLGVEIPHETARWMNNRAENTHLVFRRRERVMYRLRSVASLQKFVSIQGQIQNHFNAQRHLINQFSYRKFCSEALCEWQILAA